LDKPFRVLKTGQKVSKNKYESVEVNFEFVNQDNLLYSGSDLSAIRYVEIDGVRINVNKDNFTVTDCGFELNLSASEMAPANSSFRMPFPVPLTGN